jgi:competence protein ComEC
VEEVEYEGSSLRRWVAAHAAAEPRLMRLEGRLAQDPDQTGQRWLLAIDVEQARADGAVLPLTGKARVYVDGHAERPALIQTDRVAVWARVGLPRPRRNPGGFDSAAHLFRRGIHVVGSCKSPRLVEQPAERRAAEWRSAIARLRDVARQRLRAELGDDASASIVRAMVLGDRAGLTSESEEARYVA